LSIKKYQQKKCRNYSLLQKLAKLPPAPSGKVVTRAFQQDKSIDRKRKSPQEKELIPVGPMFENTVEFSGNVEIVSHSLQA